MVCGWVAAVRRFMEAKRDDQEKRAQGCFAVRYVETSLRIYYEDLLDRRY